MVVNDRWSLEQVRLYFGVFYKYHHVYTACGECNFTIVNNMPITNALPR